MGKMRATTHNGRWGRGGGAYSTKHNDRQFDVDREPHINADKIRQNLYWDCYNGFFSENEKSNAKNQMMNFDEVEKIFYEKNFNEFLNDRNSKYIKRRQYKNVWTADDYRKRKNSCPEETIFQIGKQGETVDAETLKNVFLDFKAWHEEHFPQIKILNFALHCDEATPHIQMRRVWVAEENGKKCVSQNKVLEILGLKKPKNDKETHRWNNPKQTFTAQCREKFLDLCEEYSLEVEREPQEASKVGLDMVTYQRQQEELRLENIRLAMEGLKAENQKLKDETKDLKAENAELKKHCHTLQTMKNSYSEWIDRATKEYSDKNGRLKIVNAELEAGEKKLEKLEKMVSNCDMIKKEYEFATKDFNDLVEVYERMIAPLIDLKESEKYNDFNARELAIGKISQVINKVVPKMAMYDDIYRDEFKKGYQKFCAANPQLKPFTQGIAFLSEVAKVHGTNADTLFSAARDVAEVNGDSSSKNIQNLYMGATSTQPYKQSQQIGGKGVLSAFVEKIDGKYDKWATLSIPISNSNNDNLFDENLSESEKADRIANQSVDNYGL